jgi:hypothetical protein
VRVLRSSAPRLPLSVARHSTLLEIGIDGIREGGRDTGLRVWSLASRRFAEQRELILSGIFFLAEHPQDPVQLLFVAIVGEDRVTQPTSSRLVHMVPSGLVHQPTNVQPKRNERG